MEKIYPEPKDKGQNIPDSPEKKTMGVYDRPNRKKSSRGMILALIIVLVIVIAMLISSGFASAGETTAVRDAVFLVKNSIEPVTTGAPD